MFVFDVIRHPDDIEEADQLTALGWLQMSQAKERLESHKLAYDIFMCSDFDRSKQFAGILAQTADQPKDPIIDSFLRSQYLEEWTRLFTNESFLKFLPLSGSKYNATMILGGDLLYRDGNTLIEEINYLQYQFPSKKILAVSHNTMILAAFDLVKFGEIGKSDLSLIDHCEGCRFTFDANSDIQSELISFA
jgi:broad specificity phosphatase PhoE